MTQTQGEATLPEAAVVGMPSPSILRRRKPPVLEEVEEEEEQAEPTLSERRANARRVADLLLERPDQVVAQRRRPKARRALAEEVAQHAGHRGQVGVAAAA